MGQSNIDLADEVDDDFPEYANEANKEKNRIIQEKAKNVKMLATDLEENKDRLSVLNEHLKNVEKELVHTQSLVDVKNKEIETEDHLKQLAERQAGRTHSTLVKIKDQMQERQDRLNFIQAEIFKSNEKLDQFKLEMNWNQEELEQWALASRQKEEDNLAL